jgi:hypothetical protein
MALAVVLVVMVSISAAPGHEMPFAREAERRLRTLFSVFNNGLIKYYSASKKLNKPIDRFHAQHQAMKVLSIGFLLVGIVWSLALLWTYMVMSGISTPVSFTALASYYGPMLIGPMLLIVGAILVLTGFHPKMGSILTIIGCTILTILVGYSTAQDLHPEPLQMRPSYGIDLFLIIVALLSDWAAFRLCQLAFSRAV